eukprot:Sdes_comp15827_c0_seq1m4904
MVVDLGFLSVAENSKYLQSEYFPSKVGGIPAWLNPLTAPCHSDICCQICRQSMVFLLQIYAPLSMEQCFHRSVFVFCCANGKCHFENDAAKIFKVFRNQLPAINQFYKTPENQDSDTSSGSQQEDSGLVGRFSALDLSWKYFQEYEIITETEPSIQHQLPENGSSEHIEEDASTDEEEDSSTRQQVRLSQFQKIVTELRQKQREAGENFDEENWDDSCFEQSHQNSIDETFKQFQHRISAEPEQICRYERGGQPLWVSDQIDQKLNSLCCKSCGGKVVFEFQILPQLLYFLRVERLQESTDSYENIRHSIDWGTLAIYTCANSCSLTSQGGSLYLEEHIIKQNFSLSAEES